MVRHPLTALCISAFLTAGCSSPSSELAPPAVAAPAVPALGIRPNGDTEISPDMSQVHSEELTKVYAYWPAYLFAGGPLDIPIVGGAAGHGGRSHAANEYFVIEGAGRVYGMAGAEKPVATVLL